MRTILSALAFLAILVSLPLSWWLVHRQDRSPSRDRVVADPTSGLFLAGGAGLGHVSSGGGNCSGAGADCGGGSGGDCG